MTNAIMNYPEMTTEELMNVEGGVLPLVFGAIGALGALYAVSYGVGQAIGYATN